MTSAELLRPAEEKFWAKVDRSAGPALCWPWTGPMRPNGYGTFSYKRRSPFGSHRVAYLFTYDFIPDGAVVCHTCDSPGCCNPTHLWAGTQSANLLDMNTKGRRDYSSNIRGEQHGGSKIDDSVVIEVFRLNAAGVLQGEIARRVGVWQGHVSRILRRKSWAHVSVPGDLLRCVPALSRGKAPMPEVEKQEILRLLGNGRSAAEVVEVVGKSLNTVYRVRRGSR